MVEASLLKIENTIQIVISRQLGESPRLLVASLLYQA
jgi:hypothetical protein